MNLNERMNAVSGLNLPEYELIDVKELSDINSAGLLLRHKKSGARVVVISNDDNNKVFSIGFKTPPNNDTGLQHIIEHSTLCGSRKYPVKDPFVELCKGSLNTFLNAMTYADKTIYPVASCNDADFKNIMDVYMDAVFYPNMYNNKKIFMQEGWHHELDSKDGAITYNGVVYNEMKGVYSSPDDVLSRLTFVSLFPDTTYRFESGGDPDHIPELSYEEFLDYHHRFYHPVNSYIYLYGDMDIRERLEYLDREYLKDFDAAEVVVDSSIELQKPFDKMTEEEHFYAVTEDEPLEDNSYISYNKVIGTATDPLIYIAVQILDYCLIAAPGARLKQALVDKGVGTDVYSNFETSVYQPVYSVVVKNSSISKKKLFIDTINEVLEDILENGIDMRMIDAGINYYEFKYREADFGSYPKGLMYCLTMMDSWLYDDSKPFVHLQALDIFDKIKTEKNNGLFENIIRDYLLNNNHGSVVTLSPKRGLEEEREEKTASVLAEYKKGLSDEELQDIIASTEELKSYQDEPSSQEDLLSIPMLKLEDIKKEAEELKNSPVDIEGVTVVNHDIYTNGIAYVILSFNCEKVPDELISYLGLLSSTLGLMDTDNFTYPELSNEININTGGISSMPSIYDDAQDNKKYGICYLIRGKALYNKVPFLLDMMKEIIYHAKFDDYKRLKEIISRVKSRLETSMTSQGHVLAYTYGESQFSPVEYYSSKIRGYDYYLFISRLENDFDTVKEEISANLKRCMELIFTKDNLLVSCTADKDGFEQYFTEAFRKFIPSMPEFSGNACVRQFVPKKVKTAFTSSSQVQYVARCGNFVNKGYQYTGALKVLKIIFSYEYLWINIRVKGGAYGCMSGFSRNGDSYLVSYRDPNLRKTDEIFANAGDYVESFDASDRDMLKYIIGTIGIVDIPKTPADKGLMSFYAYLTHTPYEFYQKMRDEILSTNVQTIRELAPMIKDTFGENYLCVVGNQKAIEQESDMFDAVAPLFKNGPQE